MTNSEITDRLEHVRTLLDAATPGPWTATTQRDDLGFLAQVFADGRSLAQLEPTHDDTRTSADAALLAAAPDLARLALDLAADLAAARQELTRVRAVADAANELRTRYWSNYGSGSYQFITTITPDRIPAYWHRLDRALREADMKYIDRAALELGA